MHHLKLYEHSKSRTPFITITHAFEHNYSGKLQNFGSLVVYDYGVYRPKSVFPMHPHVNFEILTYIIDGSLMHKDSMGKPVS